jgi:sigma-B regulation protein RsbU (phosphoserine phosphatase)
MNHGLMHAIRKGLDEKHAELERWLKAAPSEKKGILLGPQGENVLQTHLNVIIDESLEKIGEGTLGICTICHGIVDDNLLQMDYTACICLDHYSAQERRDLENELELSQIVQRALLPQQIPSIEGMDIAAFSRPAQIVSGDYFDFLQFNDGAHGVVIGDVSGKGMSAGMLMSSLQTAFHTLVPESDSPVKVLERINRLYIHNINFTTFVTVLFGKIDPLTKVLTYANAGHNPAFLYHRNSRKSEWLPPTGAAIGLMEKFSVQPKSVSLESGDILLFYTDGITEAFNPQRQQYGQERLAEIIQQNEAQPAENLISKILEALNDFVNGQSLGDDITLIVCKMR